MQFTINSFRQLFPDKIFFPDNSLTFPWFSVKSLTFPWQRSNSPTFPGFPDKWSPYGILFVLAVFLQGVIYGNSVVFTHWCCPFVRSFVCLSVYRQNPYTKTRFRRGGRNLVLVTIILVGSLPSSPLQYPMASCWKLFSTQYCGLQRYQLYITGATRWTICK